MQTAPTTQAPSLCRKKIGDIVVTAVLDGIIHGNFEIVKGIEANEGRTRLASRFLPPEPKISVNCFVVHTGGKVVLIDSGVGKNPIAEAGGLPAALDAAGVSPDSVDTILVSHLHSDHVGGLVDESGRAVFPNAELLLHADEAKFWLETTNPPEAMKDFFEAARNAVKPYRERMRTFVEGEVAPGITAEPLPGHTPGHTGFHIGNGNETLLMWTDIMHLPALQAADPNIFMAFDADPEQAKAQRKRLLEKAAVDKLLVCGSHLDFPTFSHVENRSSGGYAIVADVWRPYVR